MKLIRQKHINGCGVACIATIAGITYDQAMSYVHPNRKKGQDTTSNIDSLKIALFNLKISYLETWKKSIFLYDEKIKDIPIKLSSIKNPAIIVVDLGNKSYHAVVWDFKNKKILDPEKSIKRNKSFYENKIKLYLEVNI